MLCREGLHPSETQMSSQPLSLGGGHAWNLFLGQNEFRQRLPQTSLQMQLMCTQGSRMGPPGLPETRTQVTLTHTLVLTQPNHKQPANLTQRTQCP